LIFVDFPKQLVKYDNIIAEKLFSINKNIKVIVKKTKKYSGKYRLPRFKIIAGENRLETEFKENGCRFRIDIGKCYFSPRMSNERKRIAELVKPKESVLVMFSGIGIFPVIIAKNSSARVVYGIELNKNAHKFAEINIVLNKILNVRLFNGNVKKVLPKIKKKFDRILMPLPKGAIGYIEVALSKIKRKGIIHFYDFEEDGRFERITRKIEKYCKRANKNVKILDMQKCGQYAPRVFRVCVDFEVIKS